MTHLDLPGSHPAPAPTTPNAVGVDPTVVIRRRLLDRLSDGPAARVTVLRAPAGYGKTVLAGQWVAARSALPVAWVDLRPTDDARRIGLRLAAAVESLGLRTSSLNGGSARSEEGARSEERARSEEGAIGERLLSVLRHQLESIGGGVLVLDGLDAPEDAAMVSELERWVTTLPLRVRVLITRRGRSGPALTAVRGELTTVEATELAFTPDEMHSVVRHVCGMDLRDEQVDALVERSEGWPYAVQVAATGMRGQVDVDTVLARLHGGNRHIAAILSAEVFQPQSDEVRQLLLHTSVLDALVTPLCATVAGSPLAGSVLQELEQTGAFTWAVAAHPEEHRYHHLFRDFLRARLRATEPGAEQRILGLASDWYAVRGAPDEATRYAIRAEDPDRLLALIDRFTRPQFERGDPGPMLRALDALPMGGRPDIALRRAYLLTMSGETRRAEHVLRDAGGGPTDPGTEAVSQALRASWVFFDAAPQRALAAADRALELLGTTEAAEVPDVLGLTAPEPLEVIAIGCRARALWCTGELEPARAEMLAMLRRRDLYVPWRVHVMSATAILDAWAGNLRSALAHGGLAMRIADRAGLREHPATLDARLAVAHVHLERDELGRSDRLLEDVEARLERHRRPATVAMWTVERALWCLAAGQSARGLATIRELRVGGEPPPPPIVADRLRAVEARLLVAHGELERAAAAARSVAPASDSALSAAAVRVSVARGDLQQARARWAGWTNRPTDLKGTLERELWSAIIAMESGQRTAGPLNLSERVAARAAVEGHRRLFLDAGLPGERVVRALIRVAPSNFLRDLLSSADARQPAIGAAGTGLSERELQILRYLPTDLSSAEIADHLYISLNTLKTHLRTIYRKLEVSGRREAIERAAASGIA